MKIILSDEEFYQKGRQGLLNLVYKVVPKPLPLPKKLPIGWSFVMETGLENPLLLEKVQQHYIKTIEEHCLKDSIIYKEAQSLKEDWKNYSSYLEETKKLNEVLLIEGDERVVSYFSEKLSNDKVVFILASAKHFNIQDRFDLLNLVWVYEVKFSR